MLMDEVDKTCDFVFGRADNVPYFLRLDRHVGATAKPVMQCSDHSPSEVGRRFTWVKADPTFPGLRMAVREPESRVLVGDSPLLLQRVASNKTKFIQIIGFRKKQGSGLSESWMDGCNVPINPGLVAIIGNKGSGKSALSDAIGLLGNSTQYQYFSFLSESKFRSRKTGTKAEHFDAELVWMSGKQEVRNLNEDPPKGSPEMVKYIPQDFLEKICNEVRRLEEGDFDRELKSVIFSHVDPMDRLSCHDLNKLLGYSTETSQTARAVLEAELSVLNREILEIEKQASLEYRSLLNGLLAQKQQELAAHGASMPSEVARPATDPEMQKNQVELLDKAASTRESIVKLEAEIGTAAVALTAANKKEAAAQRLVDKVLQFRRVFAKFQVECAADAAVLGINPESLVRLDIDESDLNEARRRVGTEVEALRMALNAEVSGSLPWRKSMLQRELDQLQHQLDKPGKAYEFYLAEFKKWQDGHNSILGDESVTGSLRYIEKQIGDLSLIPEKLRVKREARAAKVREVFSVIRALAEKYRSLFRGVDEFVHRHELAAELSIRFRVDIVPMEFEDTFLNMLNQRRAGTFAGADEGRERLRSMVESIDFQSEEQVVKFVESIADALRNDRRGKQTSATKLEDQLRKGVTPEQLCDFIYSLSFLRPRYVLEWMGKDLTLLSPGERGTLLLVFYLLMDKSDIPLVIDQPEGNLDNETVYKVLVKCLADVKKRRQVVLVTHNPNLAVVCDADQVICADIDRQAGNRVNYVSGALECASINQRVVDVLEGTKPAFDNRDDKYGVVESAACTG